MSKDERIVGQEMVTATIEGMLRERDLEPEVKVNWHLDFDRDVYNPEIFFAGQPVVWKISGEDLEDYPNDQSVRQRIDAHLRMYVIPQRN